MTSLSPEERKVLREQCDGYVSGVKRWLISIAVEYRKSQTASEFIQRHGPSLTDVTPHWWAETPDYHSESLL